jgi:hypothetical protein
MLSSTRQNAKKNKAEYRVPAHVDGAGGRLREL